MQWSNVPGTILTLEEVLQNGNNAGGQSLLNLDTVEVNTVTNLFSSLSFRSPQIVTVGATSGADTTTQLVVNNQDQNSTIQFNGRNGNARV